LLTRNTFPFETICEIGCGSGGVLAELAGKLPPTLHYLGVDISNEAINMAKKKETQTLKFELKDITEKSDNRHFDLLLVIDVIEHIPNYFYFLERIQPKSIYTVFHIPLDIYTWSLFREKMLIESKDRVGHIHNFTEDFIISILTDYGFKVIDKMYTTLYESHSLKQKIVNSMRKIIFSLNERFCTKTLGGYSILLLTENMNGLK